MKQLAAAADIAMSTLSRKLAALYPFDTDELVRIAAVLRVEVTDLLPRLDSNQQPSDYQLPEVEELATVLPFRRRDVAAAARVVGLLNAA